MNYYLVIIESNANLAENLVSTFSSEIALNPSDSNAIMSIMTKYIECIGLSKENNSIGKISLYKLSATVLEFTTDTPVGEFDEEDLLTGEIFPVIVYSKNYYSTINEGTLIKQWANYTDFIQNQK